MLVATISSLLVRGLRLRARGLRDEEMGFKSFIQVVNPVL